MPMFVDSEAEVSDGEMQTSQNEKGRTMKLKPMEDSSDEEEDDEDLIREEMGDLINDVSSSESEDNEDTNTRLTKRKHSIDSDDQLEDDDYDLLEENLGCKVKRKKSFKRLRRILDDESDDEPEKRLEEDRDVIANELFEHISNDDDDQGSEVSRHRIASRSFVGEESDVSDQSDIDNFIVDDDGRPIAEKRPKRSTNRSAVHNKALQEAQEIFGIDFDYDEFRDVDENETQELEEDIDDELANEDEVAETSQLPKRTSTKSKRSKAKTIFEIYEPSELKRGHFTDLDNEIRNKDMPERMQVRSVPVTPASPEELELEAEWIYKQAFCRPTLSVQDAHLTEEARDRTRKGPQAVGKIQKSLDLMRNSNLEVPFISFYRKECVLPELNINDLWKVYQYDAKWCELRERKANLLILFDRLRDYQLDEIMKNPDLPLPDNLRIIKEDDLDRLKNAETSEEFNDVYHHFMLYYSRAVQQMQQVIRRNAREAKLKARHEKRQSEIANDVNSTIDTDLDTEVEDEPEEAMKQAVRTGPYDMCTKAGLDGFAKRFGLTPDQFAENVRDNYQRHEVEQEPVEPSIIAYEYMCAQFPTKEAVIEAVKQMVAIQISREPLLRKTVREMYMEKAKISVRPTKTGAKEIDENHPLYAIKYLKDKPVRDLIGDEYLKLFIAETDKLVTISFSDVIAGTTSDNYANEIKQLYHRDEFSKNVQEWNALRAASVEKALTQFLLPEMKKELAANLIAESKEFVLRACCRTMYNWIKVAPYEFTEQIIVAPVEEEWDTPTEVAPTREADKSAEWDTSKGIRVMGISYVPDYHQAAFACIVAPSGDCTDHLRLPNLLRRKNSFRENDGKLKENDLATIRDFILKKKPHVIVIGGESREAVTISKDLKEIILALNAEEEFPSIQVEICDNEPAKIYANIATAIEEFKEYPELLRQAISLARRMQDPLVEFSQLCTQDNEILCLRFHPYQDHVSKDDLLENLSLEFVNRVNEVGLDINKAASANYSGNLLQFVCGLGPRKSAALIKFLRQSNQRIENRTQLVTTCHMGPKVFINCAGFIKIDTSSLGDSSESYVEILDGTRVHPETYEWARKMAVDALEYDDEEANPAGALEEIIAAPEKLKDLDLDAFADELERQGFGMKCTTLYDIRSELNCRYKDLRAPYETPTPEKLFNILTKETPETFYIGKMITATVCGFTYKKPEGEQLDQANPVRNDETGLWQCQFCMKNDFPGMAEVWNHYDAASDCPGKAIGVKLRLDNGISGFIHVKNISDKRVENPEERVRIGQVVHCRILKIEVDRFSIECTSKSSDLIDKNNDIRPQRDTFYDTEAEDSEKRIEREAKLVKQQQIYMKRVIVHSCFQNINYVQSLEQLKSMKQGEALVRPSSKGPDRLTISWKVCDGVYHHIDVRETEKPMPFSLGKKLWIGNEEFEDLDEIIARHINPMAAYVAELLECQYYRPGIDGDEAKANAFMKDRKKEKPSTIPVLISPSKTYPTKFLLSYLPREHCAHEYVTVIPDGVRYRNQVFTTVPRMFEWFKVNFRKPRPPPLPKTPVTVPGLCTAANGSAMFLVTPNSYNAQPDKAASGGYGGAPYTPSSELHSSNWDSADKMTSDSRGRGRGRGRGNFSRGRRNNSGDNFSRGQGRGRGRGRGNSYSDCNNSGFSHNASMGNKTPLWDEEDKDTNSSIGGSMFNTNNTSNPMKSSNVPNTAFSWDASEDWGSESPLPVQSVRPPVRNNPYASSTEATLSSCPTPTIASSAITWDASEDWGSDSPVLPQKNLTPAPNLSRNVSAATKPSVGRTLTVASSAITWDASEDWGSESPVLQPKVSTPAPNSSRNVSAATAPSVGRNPTVASSAITWDASEDWGSESPVLQPKISTPAPNLSRNVSAATTSSVGRNPTVASSAITWDASEDWGSESPVLPQKTLTPAPNLSRNVSAAAAPSVGGTPTIGSGAITWDASEDWGSDSPVAPQNIPASTISQQNTRVYTASSLAPIAPSHPTSWNENKDWNSSASTSVPSTPSWRNKSYNSYDKPGAPRGMRGARRGARGAPRGARGSMRGTWGAQRGTANAPMNRNPRSWNEKEDWDSPEVTPNGQSSQNNYNSSNKASFSADPHNSGPGFVPIISNSSLWNESEDWDSPAIAPVTTGSASQNKSAYNSSNTTSYSAGQHNSGSRNVPIIPKAPLWNESEDWDSSAIPPVTTKPPTQNNSYNSSNKNSYSAGRRSSGLAIAPIVPNPPLWNESEDWDSPASPKVASTRQPPQNNSDYNSSNKASYSAGRRNSGLAVAPIVPNPPLWNESEDWDSPASPEAASTRKPPQNNSGYKSVAQPTAPRDPRNTSPAIARTTPKLWNESEDWDSSSTGATPNIRPSPRNLSTSNNASAASSASGINPIVVTRAPLWSASEDWDSPASPGAPNKSSVPVSKAVDESRNGSEISMSTNYSNYGNVPINTKPLWEESDDWDSVTPVTVSNPSSTRQSYQSSKPSYHDQRKFSNNSDQSLRDSTSVNSGFTHRPYQNRQKTMQRPYLNKRGSSYRDSGREKFPTNYDKPQSTSRSTDSGFGNVPLIPNTSLWSESEDWDSPAATAPTSTAPRSWQQSSNSNNSSYESNKPNQRRNFDRSNNTNRDRGSFRGRTGDMTGQADRRNTESSAAQFSNNRTSGEQVTPSKEIAPAIVPIITNLPPLYAESESWD